MPVHQGSDCSTPPAGKNRQYDTVNKTNHFGHKTNHLGKFVHNQKKNNNQKTIIYQTEFGMSGNEERKRRYVHK